MHSSVRHAPARPGPFTPAARPASARHGIRTLAAVAALAATMAAASPAHAARPDLDKVPDHPLVSRFAGSKVIGYIREQYGETELPAGPWVTRDGGKAGFEKMQPVEGRITRIAYQLPEGRSTLEVYRNFAGALEKAGFVTRFECAKEACGDAYELGAALQAKSLPALEGDGSAMINSLRATGNPPVRMLLAHRDRGAAPAADVSLYVTKGDTSPAGALLTIVEQVDMATDQVVVDAKAIGGSLQKEGHVALYGIEFDTDSATLRPSSDATLAQMATLMKEQPALKLYVVGHTDNSGSLAYNQTLSQQRADAVVKALVGRHGIAAARLAAKGLASYAPVASNADEAGRARNRRVELVGQ